MSAIVGRKEIMNCLEKHQHIYLQQVLIQLVVKTALATIQMIEDQSLLQASAEKGEYVRKRMDQWVSKYNSVGNIIR
ncbi:hypothetical protein ACVQ9Z_13730 [Staphylococcus aureus]